MGNHLCCRLITPYIAQSQSSGSLNVWDNTKTLEYCTVAETDQPCTVSDAHFRSNSYLRDLNTFAHMIVGYEAAGIFELVRSLNHASSAFGCNTS